MMGRQWEAMGGDGWGLHEIGMLEIINRGICTEKQWRHHDGCCWHVGIRQETVSILIAGAVADAS